MPRLFHHAFDCSQVASQSSATEKCSRRQMTSPPCSSRSRASRSGLTLLGVIVVLIVAGIGVALAVPAINSAREAARRSTCKRHLEQIGLGINNYHNAFDMLPMHGTGPTNEFNDDCCSKAMQPGKYPHAPSFSRHQLSYLVGLLPFCEQQELWETISNPHVDDRGNYWPAFGPAPYTAEYQPWNTDVSLYRCPSDPNRGAPTLGRTNYACCVGDSMWRTDNAGWSYFKGSKWRYGGSNQFRRGQVEASVRGVFVPRRVMRYRDVLDGLSNTIVAAEIATYAGDDDFRTTGSRYNGRDNVLKNPKYCADAGQIDPERPKFWRAGDSRPDLTSDITTRGSRWADFRPIFTQFNTILPPNSEICLRGSHAQDGVMSSSSRHPGGTHVLMGDGAVIFITDSIESGDDRAPVVYRRDNTHQHGVGDRSPYGLWGALGTRSSKEIVEETT